MFSSLKDFLKKHDTTIYKILLVIFILVILFSTFEIVTYLYDRSRKEDAFNDLKSLITDYDKNSNPSTTPENKPNNELPDSLPGDISNDNTGETDNPNTTPENVDNTQSPNQSAEETTTPGGLVEAPEGIDMPSKPSNNTTSIEKLQPQDYSNLKELNSDFVGWIRIPDTAIDLPVMQTNSNPDYYLRKDFYGNYSTLGTPYVEEDADVNLPSDMLTIYGHHIKGGQIFGALDYYKQESFFKSHRYVYFETMNYAARYEIIAVFKTVVYTGKPDEFKYWQFQDASSEEEYDEFIEKIKALSLYNISETAHYGDKLIALSTCEYSNTNGRMVVVAKMVDRVNK